MRIRGENMSNTPFHNVESKPFRAFVFSGGGAFAVGELGFVDYLLESKTHITSDLAIGTSFGALAASALKTNMKKDVMFAMMNDFENKVNNVMQPWSVMWAAVTFTFRWGLGNLMDVLAPYYGAKEFPDNLTLCTTQLETMKPKFWTYKSRDNLDSNNPSLLEAVSASASMPIVFTPQLIKGKHYIDGGMVEQIPTSAVPPSYSPIITGSYPARNYYHEVKNFSSYIESLIAGPIYYMNSINTKPLPNAHVIPLKSHAKHVLDFSHWKEDFDWGYKQAEEFFKITSIK